MILDSGLDNACTTPASGFPAGPVNPFGAFVQWAAFGSGSTPADPSDLLLENQVGARSNTDGGFAGQADGALDAGNNLLWTEEEFTRIFNITSAVTAREWGLAPAGTGNLSARDLFRDLSNNPTAIPLEDGDQLQLVIRLRVQAAWEYEAASFVIAGAPGHDSAGSHDGLATVSSGAGATYANVRLALHAVWPGGTDSTSNARAHATTVCLASQTGIAKNQNLTGTRVRNIQTAEAYEPGDTFRDWVATFSTSEAVGDIHAFVAGNNVDNENVGLRFILTDPPFLTKTDTERLVLTVRKHIARA